MSTKKRTRPAKVKNYELDWMIEDYDANDNAIYCAAGGSTDGESADLHYRITQEVREDKHCFVEASSPELMHDEDEPRRWRSLKAAQNAMGRDYLGLVASYVADESKTAR